MIELKGVSKTYKSIKGVSTNALKNINLKFDNKGLVFVVGKSGSGKSTLLNLLGGLDSPDKGQIIVNEEDICKYNDKQFDSYRNSYVGFVFQEFNLLEEFNVYENINLSLELQRKKDKTKVKDILKKVGLDNYGDRNTNELSGGQKQRVSIARALIKNPSLILADEPTGNLDRKSSEQIFELLKEISSDKLVIVVSHDIESATTYADRIIKIEDGIIVDDSKPISKVEKGEVSKYVVSRIPNNYILKMVYSYMMSKPFRLIMTILISLVALSFMGFAINVSLFDSTTLLINTMEDNNNYNLKIEHKKYEFGINDTRWELPLSFDEKNYNYLEQLTQSSLNKEYSLNENGNVLSFELGDITSEFEENDLFTYKPSSFRFIELNDNRIIKNIIGNYPNDDEEIVVHKYFADYIINFGIKNMENEYYYPKDYNEIISNDTYIKLGIHSVRITGIVDDNDELYKRSITGEFSSEELKRFYYDNYSSKSSIIYVNSSFINNIVLSNNIDSSNLRLKYNGNKTSENVNIINSDIEYIDLNGNIKKTNNLNIDEVIISLDAYIDYFPHYNDNLNDYLKKNSNKKYKDLIKEYTINYIKNNKMDSNIIQIVDLNGENAIYSNIIGITLDESNYISNKYLDNYNGNKKNVNSVIVYQDDRKVLENIFENTTVQYTEDYFLPGEKYVVSYDNSQNVSGVIYVYRRLRNFLFNFSLVLICFSALLVLNFISVSIDSNRKEIGILRSIGTSNKDIVRLFGYESLIISIISWVFGILSWLAECKIINDYLFGKLYFTLNGIVINYTTIILVLIFNLFTSFVITTIIINKINKVKPIEVILNK